MVWKCVIDYTSYVIDYQRLWTLGIQILNEESQLFKKNNCVINYTNSVIDYQRGFSRNIANSHILLFEFWMAIKGLYISDLGYENSREFCLFKMSYPLKWKRERYQENFIAKCSHKRNSWANTCKSIKSFSMDFNCNILLFKREFFFLSSHSKRLIKGPRVS